MRLRQYDPEKSVSYLKLIETVLHHYDDFRRPEDILGLVGERRLTDVTHTPEMGDAVFSLYDGGDQRIYQFKESLNRGGTIDVTFNRNRLENFHGHLFFEGIWGKAGAIVYGNLRFARLIDALVGRNNIRFEKDSHQYFCHYHNLVVSYNNQIEMGIPILSISIVTRQVCPGGIFSSPGELTRFALV
ncbi:hypothetical protein [Dehalogenimonas sp. 4OHTPN]|uniref:Uncharacterized protein n=1 Tax=Dehalogenimonas sp. 4OHTPN TaxID=3166643 RepID=A0AAU8G8U0_9CHLR